MTVDDHSPGLVLLCTKLGIIQQVARDDLGVTWPEITGQSFASLVDPASAEKAATFFASVVEHGIAYDWELNLQVNARITALHFVGAVADVQCVIAGALSCFDAAAYCAMVGTNDEHGNALQAALKEVALFWQRTQPGRLGQRYEEFSRLNNELVNMQRELAKKNAELARLNEEKNRFLGIVAHDLRNPLGVILSYNQILSEELSAVLTEQQQQILTDINSAVEFMQRLIDDLLDIAKVELGNLQFHRQQTDLVALVQHSVILNRPLAGRKHIQLTFASDDNVPPLILDRAQIEQALNNLISNAIKFSHPHTTVDVRVACGDRTVVVTVKDQGQGIPADEFDKLFKPFQRTRVVSTGGEPSTGLGLTIVQKIVTEHGGCIRVESDVGKGTAFHVSLPVPGERPNG